MQFVLWTIGYRRDGLKRRLFIGVNNDVEARFNGWLKKTCTNHAQDLIDMGLLVADLGTHSFRKGVTNYLHGMVGGPSIISIYLRAGWSLGPVQSRYILEGQGGDQLCGRAATGLPITEKYFSDLPPHFDQTNEPILSTDEWESLLSGYATYYSL